MIFVATVVGGVLAATIGRPGSNNAPTAPLLVVKAPSPSLPAPVPTAAPSASPTPLPPRLLTLGINVARSNYYSSERTFANLAFASGAWRDPTAAWADVPRKYLTPAGTPLNNAALFLNIPQGVWAGKPTNIECTWSGSGKIRIKGDAQMIAGNHIVRFTWPGRSGAALPKIYLLVDSINVSDPLKNLDCREPGLVANGVFDQRIIDDLKPYKILRFLDWSNANSNPESVSWATRSMPDRLVQDGTDGIALEHMVDLANSVGADAWFTIPWNADETYVRAMAKLVHDRLAAGRHAYFELSNETWNLAFPVAKQVLNEGLAEGLSGDKYANISLRYAEKSIWFHRLITGAFRDNPSRLIRVLNIQAGNENAIDQEMMFKDTPQWIDAIATAPYFGYGLLQAANADGTNLSALFAALETARIAAINHAIADKASATKWSKRYLSYEGGQGIVPTAKTATIATQMQRSPLMHDIYRRYLDDWKTKIGDTLMLYSATSLIGQNGAWGIREYAGQPLAASPKRRAVLEAVGATN